MYSKNKQKQWVTALKLFLSICLKIDLFKISGDTRCFKTTLFHEAFISICLLQFSHLLLYKLSACLLECVRHIACTKSKYSSARTSCNISQNCTLIWVLKMCNVMLILAKEQILLYSYWISEINRSINEAN